jgi:hypothetical protein
LQEVELRRLQDEIARAIAAEMGRSWHFIRATIEDWVPPRADLPTMFGIGTGVYTALSDRLSVLPPESVVLVVAVYNDFAWLNQARSEYDRLDDRRGRAAGQYGMAEMSRLTHAFDGRLRATLPLCQSVCEP